MNKVYRVVWNSALSAWVVASEFASRCHARAQSVSAPLTQQSKPIGISLICMCTVLVALNAKASQNNKYEIPLCTTGADCQHIVIAHGNSPKAASANNDQGWYLVQNRKDGNGATSTVLNQGNYAVAIGDNAVANGAGVSLGSNTNSAILGVAIGGASEARTTNSIAIGPAALSAGRRSITMGRMSYANGESSMAFGPVSTASADRTIAMGNSSAATGVRAIAIGSPNTDANSNDQELSQNTQAAGADSVALGTAAHSTGASSAAVGKLSVSSGDSAAAFGAGAVASESKASAMGNAAQATSTSATAVGDSAAASGANSFSGGKSSVANANNSVALGNAAQATNTSATALGDSAAASGANSFSGGKSSVANANNSVALGNAAQATNASAMALGDNAAASGLNSVSVGKSSIASTDNTTAVGMNSKASGTYASAIGAASSAGGTYSNAVGAGSNAGGAYSFAEGKDSKASGYSSTAIGNASSATDQQAVAMGLSSTASGRRSIAIGAPSEQSPASSSNNDSDRIAKDATYATKATAADALAIGSGAQATAQYATALGTSAVASNKNTVALGKNSASSGLSAVSIGNEAKGTGNYTVSVGENSAAKGDFGAAIGNYASAVGTQALAGGYKASASQANGTSLGANSQASGPSSTAIGTSALASGESSLAAGAAAGASGAMSTSLGSGSQAAGENSTSVGRNARTEGPNALSAGYNASASETSAIALGDSASASKDNTIALGKGAQSTEVGAMALGQGANAVESDSIAIGNSSAASGENAVSLGKGTRSTVASGVALGEGANANREGMGPSGATEAFSGASVSSAKGAVSVGATDNERQIINVAGGTQDTDAVNVRQLKYVGTSLASSLGGGAVFNATTGNYTAPTFANNNRSFTNVADALSDVNSGAVKYERGTDGAINKNKATLEGGNNGTTLDNVANGTVSSSSKQAINGSQLYGTSNSVSKALGGGSAVNPDGTVSSPSYTVHNADGSTTAATNVGDALTNVDNRTAGNTDSINNINSGKAGLTQQQAAGEKITVGKDTDGTEVSFADKNASTRKLTNVSDGDVTSSSKDAINGSQLHTEQTQRQAADTGLANALGGGSAVAPDGTVTSPSYTVHNADGSSATVNNVGDALTNVDNRTVGNTDAINNINNGKAGLVQQESAGKPITVAKDTDGSEVTFADKSGTARKLTNVSAGKVSSDSTDAINGSQLYAGNQSIANALGGGSTLNPDGTVTQPTYANNGTTYTNLGDALKDVNDGAVKYNRNSDGTIDKSKASLEGGDRGTTLDNVAPGTVAADSKQAVNGSQLHTEQTQRQAADTGLANALGGGAKAADDGTVTSPSYTVHNADGSSATVNNVGDALTSVDNRTVGNTDAINNINNGKAGLVQQESAGKPITVAKDTDGSEVTFADKSGTARKLTNVAAGTIASGSQDAVNGSQLYAGNQSIANALGGGSTLNPDGTVTQPTYANNGTTYTNLGDALKDVNDGAVKYNRNSDGTIDKSKASLEGGDRGTTLDNVAPGTIAADSKQAVNGSQLYTEQTQRQTADTGLANALGGGSAVAPDGTVAAPTYALHNADGSSATVNNVGDALTNVDNRTVGNTDAINNINNGKAGLVQQESAGKPITVAKDTDGSEVTFADKSGNTRTLTNVSAGKVSSDSSDAINGSQLYAGNQSIANALGGGSTLNPDGTVTQPTYANNGTIYTNLGDALKDVNDGAVKYNRNSDGTIDKSKASLEGGDRGATLDNVASGTVAADSKQAVNGSQLYTEQTQRQAADTGLANALGGGSAVAPDGTVTAPTYALHNEDGSSATVNNVGDALTSVDNRTVGNTDAINNINNGKAGLVQQESAGKPITVAKDTDGSEVTFADKSGKTRTLTNVSAGKVSSDSTDAINGSQLYAGNQSIANALGGGSTLNPDGTVTQPTYANNGTTYTNLGDALKDVNDGAVKYNRNSDGTIDKSKASLDGGDRGTTLDNVAPGAVAADSKQAVNGGQLYATNQAISEITGGRTGLTQQAGAGEKITVGKDTDGTEVSFADKNGGTRTLSSVSDGSVTATSKEAINGSQLYTEQSQRQTADTGLANALGGGAAVGRDGMVTAPTYNLHNADGSSTTVNNVGSALTNLDGRTVNNTNAINQIANGKSGIVQQDNNDAPITVGKDSNGKNVTFADKAGNARKLTAVANGDINDASREAVNGSQLYAGNMSIANSLGGGSTVNADGTLSVPVYTLNGQQYVGVDNALQVLGQGVASHSDSGAASAQGDHSLATGAGSNASGTNATANGDKSFATGSGSTASGANSVASSTNGTAVGSGARATGENATATGAGASAGGKESTVAGANASAKGDYATANGVNAQAAGTGSTASGHGAKATANNSSAFGKDASASGTGSTAGGNAAKASGDGSTAYGQNATGSGDKSSAFGQNATADGQNGVALGAGSSTEGRDNTVSVGSTGNERTISNVADGTQPHDAATVGQVSRGLHSLGNRIGKVERHAKAGTASAMAMTGLPQAVLPGRSMLSAGGGTYEGQSAVAVGLSTMTDNGRWIIKGQVSGNTQGDVGGAVGVGYQW